MKVEEWLGVNNTIGIDIFKKKYLQEGETFDQWLDRVSGGDKDVKKLIVNKKFIFGGRILANRGLNKGTTSNCFVLSIESDSIESIYDTAKMAAQTYKSGGGVGIDITKLAPKGAKVNNAAKTTSGAVSFIDLFTTTTGLIGQNGRRGALMVSIGCDHPDIEDFIALKTDVNKATTANLSIRVSDDFMNAVMQGEKWYTSFSRPETKEIIVKEYDAKELFQKFCDANYDYGEPGLLFWDSIESYNMLQKYDDFKYAGVNPCGEQNLPDGGACLLGSMNLAQYVTPNQGFDFINFEKDVATAIGALDDVQAEGIPMLPLPNQRKTAEDWRQIGLGIMGLGDMLIKMNMRYGSDESILLCDQIGDVMCQVAIDTSCERGKKLGSFPKFDKDKFCDSDFYKNHKEEPVEYMRNGQLLCIAPTGTISTMLGVSGGIEPLFALEYDRTTKSLHGEDVTYKVIPSVVQYARDTGYVDGLVSSNDIDYKDRIRMQAIWQKHIDNAISSTINLPQNFPKEKIADIYISAWKAGLKGVTVFRDGCKRAGILNTTEKKDVSLEDQELIGVRRKLQTGCGSLWLLAYMTPDHKIKEIFISKGSSGSCEKSLVGLSRSISLSLRNGIPLESVVDQLNSCGSCPAYMVRKATKGDTSIGNCCPSAVGHALMEIQKEYENEDISLHKSQITERKIVNPCPVCGAELLFVNGCSQCICGYSKCM